MLNEKEIQGKNGRTVHIAYKNSPWREYVDEFIRDDLDYMLVKIIPGMYKSVYSAKGGLDAAIRKLKRKDISSCIINGNLCIMRG